MRSKFLFDGFRFGLLLQIAVGPICLYVFETAVTSGILPALSAVLAVGLVDSLYILAAILGIGSIMTRHAETRKIFGIIGSFVLIAFGIMMIYSGLSINAQSLPTFATNKAEHLFSAFIKTFLLTISNPLTIIFWASVFTSKINEKNLKKENLYYFGLGAVFSTIIFLSGISVLGNIFHVFLPILVLQILNIFVGIIIILFGLRYFFAKKWVAS